MFSRAILQLDVPALPRQLNTLLVAYGVRVPEFAIPPKTTSPSMMDLRRMVTTVDRHILDVKPGVSF